MNEVVVYILFFIGLLLVAGSSDIFVGASIKTAKRFGLPEVTIGATLVSVCTALPEAVISIISSSHGFPLLAFGNAAGSIFFNIGVILAVIFIIARPKIEDRRSYFKSVAFFLILLLAIFICEGISGKIGRIFGIILMITAAFYIAGELYTVQKDVKAEYNRSYSQEGAIKIGAVLVFSAFGVVFGSHIMVEKAKIIAQLWGVSDLIIGLAITGAGAAMPELATAVSALRRRAGGLAVGNIIGAGILNLTIVIGGSAAIHPIFLMDRDSLSNMLALLVLAVLIIIYGLARKDSHKRAVGSAMLITYAIHLGSSIFFAG